MLLTQSSQLLKWVSYQEEEHACFICLVTAILNRRSLMHAIRTKIHALVWKLCSDHCPPLLSKLRRMQVLKVKLLRINAVSNLTDLVTTQHVILTRIF
mmetsp:Transcript_1703/g.3961  ORF Transcript_1703/g.3961 Transcript_1703/m.3961 type:complete len:98 (-) Transcript_1703:130-423(-)